MACKSEKLIKICADGVKKSLSLLHADSVVKNVLAIIT